MPSIVCVPAKPSFTFMTENEQTGKTRVAALLIATALALRPDNAEDDTEEDEIRPRRVLAVTHSNGAADVLLQALLNIGLPAVRAGRAANVSPSLQHRTIAALSEKMPEVIRLRQRATDTSLEHDERQSSLYDARQCQDEAQTVIARSSQVVVASCIGAAQLMSSIGTTEDDAPAFDLVVLDEAGQTTEPALISALTASKANQVVLIGDSEYLRFCVSASSSTLTRIFENLQQNNYRQRSRPRTPS